MSDNNADSAGIAQLSFEEALRALESVVRQLESGEVPLDESISLYEKGEAAGRLPGPSGCRHRADRAIVAKDDGAVATRPLDDA
jgi:exodeoxyribonuclease VII small subunit